MRQSGSGSSRLVAVLAVLGVTAASAAFGAGIGGAATTTTVQQTDASRCKLPTGFPTDPDSADQATANDSPPATTCIRTTVSLLGATTSTLPKVGQDGRLRVSIQADAALVGGSSTVTIRIPTAIRTGTAPSGFTRSTLIDPFSSNARANSGDDGSHGSRLTGKVTLVAGRTATITVPVTVSAAGPGSFEVEVANPNQGSARSGERFPGSSSFAAYTFGAAGTRAGIDSQPDEETRKSPADWNANSPGSFDIPTRTLSGWSASKAANWKAAPAPLDGQGMCPGGLPKQESGICPGAFANREGSNPNQVGRTGQRRQSVRAKASATTCMDGQLVYSSPSGVHPSVNVPIEAWDVNSAIDDRIGTSVTDWSGNFHICFSNSENGYFQGGTADVKLVFISANNRFRIVNDCCAGSGWTPGTYNLETPTRNDVPAGNIDVGVITPSSSSFQRVFHAYDRLNQAWAWSSSHSPGAGTCWTNSDCNQKTMMWWPTSTEWPHYGGWCASRASSIMCMPADGPDSYHVVLHELGHNLMDDVYGGIPAHSCPGTHYGWVNEERGCAWTEGWPTWYAAAVLDLPILDGYPNVDPQANDNMGWSTYNGIGRGANVENRITSALWDIQDPDNEGAWDRMSTGPQVLWDAFRIRHPQDWEGMITAMSLQGLDTSSADFRSTLYGNTIDMGTAPFRDPLVSGVWASRPLPPVSQPSLASVNPFAAPPGSHSAAPINTSNGHNFVWNRSTPRCTDTIEVQNVGSWTSGYRQNGRNPAYSFNGLSVVAYANPDMTGQLAWASTASGSLFSVGSLALSLPASPTTVYVKVAGKTRATPVTDGSWTQVPDSQYRIRGQKCTLVSLLKPYAVGATIRATFAAELVGGQTYSVSFAPVGKSSTGKAQRPSLSVGSQGWSAPCLLDNPNSLPCAGQGTVGRALSTATSSSSAAGRPLTLAFKPAQSGIYEIVLQSLAGPGRGDVTVSPKQ